MSKTVILGSGISALSAAYHLKEKGIDSTLYEKESDWGGLCSNFTIDGFRFDRFVHFTFTNDEYIKNAFEKSSPLYDHPAISYNYYKGYWLKHPAQNNLAPLSVEEKADIIESFVNRPQKDISEIANYDEWLRVQYGDYFAENFPFAYTRKYWGHEAHELETKWAGQRMHSPDLKEVVKGAFEVQEENFYYTKYMRYPKNGGFKSILNGLRENQDIKFNKEVVRIDKSKIYFSDDTSASYSRLISSLPLPEVMNMLEGAPQNVVEAAKKLKCTCGYHISLGFNKPDIPKHLWFYIYDEDIPPARIYSPSLKSSDNVPNGSSSLQAEIFFDNRSEIPTAHEVLDKTLQKLYAMDLFKPEDIVVKEIRFEKYANVIFTHDIYENRKIVRDYLSSIGIETIGRFGEWGYLWTHQSFESGMRI